MTKARLFTSKHWTGLTVLGTVVAFLAVLGTASAGWVVIKTGTLTFKVKGGLSPSTLPRNEFGQTSLHLQGQIGTENGTQPPAAREAVFSVDQNLEADVYGLPVCKKTELEARTVEQVRKICGPAMVGSGVGEALITFPEQASIPIKTPLTIFNGGQKGHRQTLYIHAYITVPVPTAVVATLTLEDDRHGRYGTRAVLKIPKIAGGSGSGTAFRINAQRHYTFGKFKKNYIWAKCPDGQLKFKGTTIFKQEDGSSDEGQEVFLQFSLPCTPKG